MIKVFLESSEYAVVGASADPTKFGNKVLMWYKTHKPHAKLYPIHPKATEIEGLPALKNLSLLPNPTGTSVSIITPPAISQGVVEEAIRLGVKSVWLQPGIPI